MDIGFSLTRLVRTQLRRIGFDMIRYHRRPKWPEEDNRFEYQKELNPFPITPDSVVLDIGSGDYPFPLATIVSDLQIGVGPGSAHKPVGGSRPLLKLDVHHLPFQDKSIHYVYCSHVLEHVADPFQACLEIMRVGKQGYIETPTIGKDSLFAWAREAGHRWHVTAINNNLVFFEYSEIQEKGIGSEAWRRTIFADYEHPLQEAFYKNQHIFNTMFTWSDSFTVFVFRLDGAIDTNWKPQPYRCRP